MNDHDKRRIGQILKQGFAPIDTGLKQDLWPAVLRRVGVEQAAPAPPRIAWYDWALVGVSATLLLCFPRLLLVFAYYL